MVGEFVPPHQQHGVINIGQYYAPFLPDDFGKLHRQITGATSDIQHHLPLAHGTHLKGDALPQAVNTKGHQVVHHIVAACYRVKNICDQIFFIFALNSLVAEMGFIPGIVCAHWISTTIAWL